MEHPLLYAPHAMPYAPQDLVATYTQFIHTFLRYSVELRASTAISPLETNYSDLAATLPREMHVGWCISLWYLVLICQVHDLWKAGRPHAEIFISTCVDILIWMLAQFYKQEPLLYKTEI